MGIPVRTLVTVMVLAAGSVAGYHMLSGIGQRNLRMGGEAGLYPGSGAPSSGAAMLEAALAAGDGLLREVSSGGDAGYVRAAMSEARAAYASGDDARLLSIAAFLEDGLSYVGEECDVVARTGADGALIVRNTGDGVEISGRCAGEVPPGIRDSVTIDFSPLVSRETYSSLAGAAREVELGRKNPGKLGITWSIPTLRPASR